MQIDSAREDGTVVFRNGKMVIADVIMHCTGYSSFDFASSFGLGVASLVLSYMMNELSKYSNSIKGILIFCWSF